jgi:tetratricopeptide (TPR) repeat protein
MKKVITDSRKSKRRGEIAPYDYSSTLLGIYTQVKRKRKLRSAEKNWNRIEKYIMKKNFDAAIEVGKKVLARHSDPSSEIITRRCMAKIYLCMSEPDKAKKHLRKALKLDKSDSYLWFDMGECLYQQEKMKDASKAYQKAVEINPDIPDMLDRIGKNSLNSTNPKRLSSHSSS